jgi:hypothetical protein
MTIVQVSPQRLLLSGWLLTNVQVNITTALHSTGRTHIYISLVLLFMFFFTLLPFFRAGWLSSIPFVRYNPTHCSPIFFRFCSIVSLCFALFLRDLSFLVLLIFILDCFSRFRFHLVLVQDPKQKLYSFAKPTET